MMRSNPMRYPDNGSLSNNSGRSIRSWVVAVLLAASVSILGQAAEPPPYVNRVVYTVEASFEDILTDVSDAILEQGLVISGVSNVAEMLDRTGKDLGVDNPIFHRAKVLEFCSAVISRQALAADPHSIIYCPYKIAVYALPEAPERIYLAFPKLVPDSNSGSQAALSSIEKLLDDIIRQAIE